TFNVERFLEHERKRWLGAYKSQAEEALSLYKMQTTYLRAAEPSDNSTLLRPSAGAPDSMNMLRPSMQPESSALPRTRLSRFLTFLRSSIRWSLVLAVLFS